MKRIFTFTITEYIEYREGVIVCGKVDYGVFRRGDIVRLIHNGEDKLVRIEDILVNEAFNYDTIMYDSYSEIYVTGITINEIRGFSDANMMLVSETAPFLSVIEVFDFCEASRGIVISGYVHHGTLRVGDIVSFYPNIMVGARIEAIEGSYNNLITEASEGSRIGVLLKETDLNWVKNCKVMVKLGQSLEPTLKEQDSDFEVFCQLYNIVEMNHNKIRVSAVIEQGKLSLGDKVRIGNVDKDKVKVTSTVIGIYHDCINVQSIEADNDIDIVLQDFDDQQIFPGCAIYREVNHPGKSETRNEVPSLESQACDITGVTTQEGEATENPEVELNGLIGLEKVKSDVASLHNLIKIQQRRASMGLPNTAISYHCVFTGNPGTGKTTVARILAKVYKQLGLLKKGHLVEVDRSRLVAEYVGQTAVKTNKVIDEAMDGVLFIDEAYTLVGGQNDFGAEAIATLLKRMEDDRDRLVVILAGYDDEMKKFIDSNPGLQSRFNRNMHFDDYSEEELLQIFNHFLAKYHYTMQEEASQKLSELFRESVENKDKHFGNARFCRNLFERVLQNQANRICMLQDVDETMLSQITADDLV